MLYRQLVTVTFAMFSRILLRKILKFLSKEKPSLETILLFSLFIAANGVHTASTSFFYVRYIRLYNKRSRKHVLVFAFVYIYNVHCVLTVDAHKTPEKRSVHTALYWVLFAITAISHFKLQHTLVSCRTAGGRGTFGGVALLRQCFLWC